jgi:general secretion pathway protein C
MTMTLDLKRWKLPITFVLFIALCMSLTYWAMQFFTPTQRQLVEPVTAATDVDLNAAAGLFGGRAAKPRIVSNFQLKGIVLAADPAQSVAILSENGKPARALRAGARISGDVRVKEVQQLYVLLSEGGATTRIDLPQDKVLSVFSPASEEETVVATVVSPVTMVDGVRVLSGGSVDGPNSAAANAASTTNKD